MRGSRFSEEQIIGVLREHEAGGRTEGCAGGTGSRARPSTSGKRSTAAWGKTSTPDSTHKRAYVGVQARYTTGRPNMKWCGFGLIYSARLITAPDSPNPPRLKKRGFLDVMRYLCDVAGRDSSRQRAPRGKGDIVADLLTPRQRRVIMMRRAARCFAHGVTRGRLSTAHH